MNQLQLCRGLVGDVSLTEPRLLLRGRGVGRAGDELLELDLALPAPPAHTAAAPGPDGRVPVTLYYPPGFAPAARQQLLATAVTRGATRGSTAADADRTQQGQEAAAGDGDGGGDGSDEWPHERLPWSAQAAAATAAAALESDKVAAAAAAEAQRVSHVLLRRGDLHFSSTVSSSSWCELGIPGSGMCWAVYTADLAGITGYPVDRS